MKNEILSRIYLKLLVVVALIVIAGVCLWQKSIPLGLDLRGGSEMLYRVRAEDLSEAERQTITQRTIDVIRRRVDPDGRMELDIRQRGKDRFYIQLPGMGDQESQRIDDLIQRSGQLRFCLVNTDAEARARAREGAAQIRATHTPFVASERDKKTGDALRWRRASYRELGELPADETDWHLVDNVAHVTGDSLAFVNATQDNTGLPAVGFRFKGKGRLDFERLTERNQGRLLAIILDENLYSAPVIKTRISGQGIIQGNFNEPEVRDLVAVLRAGQLPADIELEWNNTVGAQLGEDSIRAGIRASIIALILVVAFMTIYYLATGVTANFAVMLNLLLVLGAMAAMNSVLTLPGIAGLVLTLGMSVDANVLINERIREEQERGKSLRPAIRSGYERAFVTILDSNLTTLITALILFGVGTGPVRGFATTLSLGIVLSMFSAVWVTRAVVDFLVEKGWLTRLYMLQIIGRPNISFTRVRHAAMAVSAVCIVVGLSVFFQRGDKKLDTDLTGGYRAEMELKTGVPIGEFRSRVTRIFPRADVQSVWSTVDAGPESGPPKRFSVRIRSLDAPERMSKLKLDLERLLKENGLFATLKSDAPWEFTAHLSGEIGEAELRALLASARYSESDIVEIVPQEAAAGAYIIRARQSEMNAEAPDKDLARILDVLEPFIVPRSVRIEIGSVVKDEVSVLERSARKGADAAAPAGYVPIKLTEMCSTAAIREAIIQDIFEGKRPKDLRVDGHGADANSGSGDNVHEAAVRASDTDLQRIAESGRKTLQVQSFNRTGVAELRVVLQSPQTETALSDRFFEAGLLQRKTTAGEESKKKGLVRSVIPIGVKEKHFVLHMSPLSEDKAVEYVKESLLAAFKDEVAAERYKATIESTEAPAEVVEREELAKKGFRFYKLTLDKPTQMQDVQAVLTRAGSKNALLETLDRSSATKDVQETYLKLLGDDETIRKTTESIKFAFDHPEAFRSIEAIGPMVAGEIKNKAILAVFLSWIAIIFYIWFRFGEVKFGIAAVVALIHDVLLTAGAVGVADALSGTAVGEFLGFSDIKVNVTMIAAFLTLVGYSINDTIVVFDRIRENMGGVRRRVDAALIDTSINQILSRTILTSFTTFMALITLYVLGGPVIHGFAFVMTFGIIVGTYSSVFIASPILIGWESFTGLLRKVVRVVTFNAG